MPKKVAFIWQRLRIEIKVEHYHLQLGDMQFLQYMIGLSISPIIHSRNWYVIFGWEIIS